MSQRRRKEMYQFVEGYLSSGQSQRAYCASQGEPLHVLNYWLGKYRRSHGGVVAKSTSHFTELSIEHQPNSEIRIKHPNGMEIYIPV